MTSGKAKEPTGQLWDASTVVTEAHFGCIFVVPLGAS